MTKRSLPEWQALIADIRTGDEKVLQLLYKEFRPAFFRWAYKHYRCSEAEVGEVYQKAFTILYYNIRDGKLETLSSSLPTYLIGIGKKVFLELFRERNKRGLGLEEVPEAQALDTSYLDKESASHQQQLVARLLNKLGDKCRQILTLYYFRKFSMEAIANEMSYKNDTVAKKKKYECLQKLKKNVAGEGIDSDDVF